MLSNTNIRSTVSEATSAIKTTYNNPKISNNHSTNVVIFKIITINTNDKQSNIKTTNYNYDKKTQILRTRNLNTPQNAANRIILHNLTVEVCVEPQNTIFDLKNKLKTLMGIDTGSFDYTIFTGLEETDQHIIQNNESIGSYLSDELVI